jgi:hypothetical protein
MYIHMHEGKLTPITILQADESLSSMLPIETASSSTQYTHYSYCMDSVLFL